MFSFSCHWTVPFNKHVLPGWITEGANLFALTYNFQNKSIWKVLFTALGLYFPKWMEFKLVFIYKSRPEHCIVHSAVMCVYEVWFRGGLAWQQLQKTEVSDSDMGCFAWADKRGAVVWEAKEFTASTFHLHRWACVYVCVSVHVHIAGDLVRRVTTMIQEAGDSRHCPGGSVLQFSGSQR